MVVRWWYYESDIYATRGKVDVKPRSFCVTFVIDITVNIKNFEATLGTSRGL